jgi:hypothetical protein
MFLFGAKALEQFLDRLVEWPKYCNEILQIPHLRGAQAELFSYIERVLTHISSGLLESNGGNGAPTDQHKGFSWAPSENLEVLFIVDLLVTTIYHTCTPLSRSHNHGFKYRYCPLYWP